MSNIKEFEKFQKLHRVVFKRFVDKTWSWEKFAAWHNGYKNLHGLLTAKSLDDVLKKLSKAERARIWRELVNEFGERLENINTEEIKK